MIPQLNDMCAPALEGKWMLGTDEPTMIDIHCAPIFEMIDNTRPGPWKHVAEGVKFSE